MSALANTQIRHTINNEQASHVVKKSVTPISVSARIDYIQRFSKQMTLVVDENTTVYSQVARQYLASISQESSKQEINVAFVAASSKINDIQMRCRLIEQLFGNMLFDPEQSLAVSLLRLAKQNNATMVIVVEHAQSLSLQIKYELCQLVDIANKTQNSINVVLFGSEQSAQEIGQNKTLFNKKVSIIDASSGQVLAIDHARFKSSTALFSANVWKKLSLAALLGITILLLAWFVVTKHENFSLAALPTSAVINESAKIIPQKSYSKAVQTELARPADIYLALSGQGNNKKSSVTKEVKPAEMSDILQALVLTDEMTVNDAQFPEAIPVHPDKSSALSSDTSPSPQPAELIEIKPEPLVNQGLLAVTLSEQYYLNSAQGYVIQIAGFSDLTVLTDFIKQYKNLEYFSYQTRLNDRVFIVLTSQIYSDKAQAIAALNLLPESITRRGSFLKSVSTIKREINTVIP
jgi:DamX protein